MFDIAKRHTFLCFSVRNVLQYQFLQLLLCVWFGVQMICVVTAPKVGRNFMRHVTACVILVALRLLPSVYVNMYLNDCYVYVRNLSRGMKSPHI